MSEPCSACGERVTGSALEYGRRVGTFRCGGTHCKHSDTPLMRALRGLDPEAPAKATAQAERIERLEGELLRHGIALPP